MGRREGKPLSREVLDRYEVRHRLSWHDLQEERRREKEKKLHKVWSHETERFVLEEGEE